MVDPIWRRPPDLRPNQLWHRVRMRGVPHSHRPPVTALITAVCWSVAGMAGTTLVRPRSGGVGASAVPGHHCEEYLPAPTRIGTPPSERCVVPQILVVANQISHSVATNWPKSSAFARPKKQAISRSSFPRPGPRVTLAAKFESTFDDDSNEAAQRQLDTGLTWPRHLGATVDSEVGDEDPLHAVGYAQQRQTFKHVTRSSFRQCPVGCRAGCTRICLTA